MRKDVRSADKNMVYNMCVMSEVGDNDLLEQLMHVWD